jgi:hypothetical protein
MPKGVRAESQKLGPVPPTACPSPAIKISASRCAATAIARATAPPKRRAQPSPAGHVAGRRGLFNVSLKRLDRDAVRIAIFNIQWSFIYRAKTEPPNNCLIALARMYNY